MQETLFKTVEFCLQESFKDFESKTFSQISFELNGEAKGNVLTPLDSQPNQSQSSIRLL